MGTFTMPSLGADMEAGVLVEWLKGPGDKVKHGDIIAVVETDKGAIEVEVFETGTLEELLVEEGSKVPVGAPLARIDGEKAAIVAPPSQAAPAPPLERPERPAPPASPVARASRKTDGKIRVSPAARALAAERGIDLASLKGTGPDGAIQLADVEQAGSAGPSAATGPDLSAMRRAIAAAMARSKREIPHYYLAHRFDVSPTLDWLDRHNAERSPPERLLLGALLLKSVALTLKEFPEFNGHYQEGGFVQASAVHLGSAIAIRGGGLAAPCIRHADEFPLAELMSKLRDLVIRTRKGQFRSSEIADATATVSSLGERGVEALWPVIYPPQVAIVGFGSVTQQAWAEGDNVCVRPIITATLAGDHRANDGHRGALLLRRIAELLSKPEDL